MTGNADIRKLVDRLNGVEARADGSFMALCPCHADHHPSLHVWTDKNGTVHAKCFSCKEGTTKGVLAALGMKYADLFDTPPRAKYGLTLAEYSVSKLIDISVLQGFGLEDGLRQSKTGKKTPGVKMPYMDEAGKVRCIRWRMMAAKGAGPEGRDLRFCWDTSHGGADLILYGLWRMPSYTRDYVVLVEGESDCHALWANGIQAFGLPGATQFARVHAGEILGQFARVYVVVEPDEGGKSLFESIPAELQPKCRFMSLTPYGDKDASGVWCKAPNHEKFAASMSAAMSASTDADHFQRPDAWKDGRQVTSADNGRQGGWKGAEAGVKGAEAGGRGGLELHQRGGRPQTDYIGLVADYARQFRDAAGNLTMRRWQETWEAFNGRHYEPVKDQDMEGRATAYLLDPNVGEAFHVLPSRTAVSNLLGCLMSTAYCGISSSIEAPYWLSTRESAKGWVALANKVVNLEKASQFHWLASLKPDAEVKGQDAYVRELTPDLFSLWSLPYEYDPQARCPKFDNWLASTLPDPEIRQAIQMMMGLMLVPDTSYNVAFFLQGEGGCGKSTFLRILKAVVGEENCCKVDLLSFDQKFEVWPLADKLVNIVGEMPTDDPLGRLRYIEGAFKDSCDGGMIAVRHVWKDVYYKPCIARHVFAMNKLPYFFDKSNGIWDRLIVVPFTQHFRGESTEVRDLAAEIIAEELPGILNFALVGLAKLRQFTRFPVPAACSQIAAEHRANCDQDGTFLRDAFQVSQEDAGGFFYVTVAEAYQAYKTWLDTNGFSRRNQATFKEVVKRVFGIRETRLPLADGNSSRVPIFKNLKFIDAPEDNGAAGAPIVRRFNIDHH